MAYTKRVWECEDLLTPEAMNHIEDGIKEISDAQEEGIGIEFKTLEEFEMVSANATQDIPVGFVTEDGWNILSVQQVYDSGSAESENYVIADGDLTRVYPNAYISAPSNNRRTVGASVYNPGTSTIKITARVVLARFQR